MPTRLPKSLGVEVCYHLGEVVWPSGWGAGLVIFRSRVQVPI